MSIGLRRSRCLALAGVSFFSLSAGVAHAASSVSICVPATAGAAITSAGSGSCSSGTQVALPSSSAAQQTLIGILPYINYEASGIDGKPTIQFSGANLQVVNGSGSESTINGEGNLIIGYDPSPGSQTGSHNLLLGGAQSDTSYAGIIAGYDNTASAPYGSALGGRANTVSGELSAIAGGFFNTAAASYSDINGGCANLVGSGTPTYSSTCANTADAGYFASVNGGVDNQAGVQDSTVSGGAFNLADDLYSSITGGCDNLAAPTGGASEPPRRRQLPIERRAIRLGDRRQRQHRVQL